jgi:hypothetical protein
MKNFIKFFGIIVFAAVICFPVIAGGSRDSGSGSRTAAVTTQMRDAASFEGKWVCDTFKDSYNKLDYDVGDYVDVSEPSAFVFWKNEVDGIVYQIAESPLLEPSNHYNPEFSVTGDTLVITVDLYADDGYTDLGRGEYAVFKIAGNTLVRTIDGTEHIYTKRD